MNVTVRCECQCVWRNVERGVEEEEEEEKQEEEEQEEMEKQEEEQKMEEEALAVSEEKNLKVRM